MRGMHNSNLPPWWGAQLSKSSLLSCVPVLAGTMMIIGYVWQNSIKESKQREKESTHSPSFQIVHLSTPHSFPFPFPNPNIKLYHTKKKTKKTYLSKIWARGRKLKKESCSVSPPSILMLLINTFIDAMRSKIL
jgi:hypothetical protein